MITVLNRKKIASTTDIGKRSRICQLLDAHHIPCIVTEEDLTKTSDPEKRRHFSAKGADEAHRFLFHVFVHKKDYDKAVHAMR